ncbi:MAG: aminotransferase class III-fold pyridoxal phosphate-dependent enzyme, partial [Firmicutes bacterium]|nr:aminotransferase class III-fold pyridoxal phosphate-dependent enzyme [Bacillota bacterium]
AGVLPDIVTLAKGLGGGLPIGATLCTDEVAEVMGPGSHGSTFGGNPVATRAACEVIDVILETGFLQGVRAGGELVLRRLAALAECGGICALRGAGLMWGIEIAGSAAAVVDACRERGLLVLTAGEHVVRLLPPLIASEAELDEGLQILEQVLMSVADTLEADAG